MPFWARMGCFMVVVIAGLIAVGICAVVDTLTNQSDYDGPRPIAGSPVPPRGLATPTNTPSVRPQTPTRTSTVVRTPATAAASTAAEPTRTFRKDFPVTLLVTRDTPTGFDFTIKIQTENCAVIQEVWWTESQVDSHLGATARVKMKPGEKKQGRVGVVCSDGREGVGTWQLGPL